MELNRDNYPITRAIIPKVSYVNLRAFSRYTFFTVKISKMLTRSKQRLGGAFEIHVKGEINSRAI